LEAGDFLLVSDLAAATFDPTFTDSLLAILDVAMGVASRPGGKATVKYCSRLQLRQQQQAAFTKNYIIMKKVLLQILGILLVFAGHAQENNPYNKRGADYMASLNIISTDYRAGKVKEINDASIKTYSRLVPLQNQVSTDMAASLLKTIKAPGYTLATAIANSSLSAYGKNTVNRLLNVKGLPADEFKTSLSNLVTEIRAARIADAEKEQLLTLLAVSYHSIGMPSMGRSNCNVVTSTYTGPVDESVCVAAAAISGFFFALPICGILCGLGGALVAGVATALS
jgi:hypothetical protein